MEARRLLLFHHDPLHSDEFLDEFCADARGAWEGLGRDATELEMGMEGGELEVVGAASGGPEARSRVQAVGPEVSTLG